MKYPNIEKFLGRELTEEDKENFLNQILEINRFLTKEGRKLLKFNEFLEEVVNKLNKRASLDITTHELTDEDMKNILNKIIEMMEETITRAADYHTIKPPHRFFYLLASILETLTYNLDIALMVDLDKDIKLFKIEKAECWHKDTDKTIH